MLSTTLTEAVEGFLRDVPVNFAKDLTSRFSIAMETQIMVDPSDGEPVYEGDTIKRNTWQCVSEDYGTYSYHHARIPRNAMSEPTFTDYVLAWPFHRHVESIGMTGWNWKKLKSCWVGFDFDSITGHAQGVGVSDEALERVKTAASEVPWVQVRRSTGGSGLHLYVYFDPDNLPDSENHNVHSALARTVLGLMEKETGFDFRGNMDVLGGNMWVWHRKVSPTNRGLEIIKDFEDFCPPLPANWRQNIDVVTGRASKVKVHGIASFDEDAFESQSASRLKVQLDEVHRQVEERVSQMGYTIIWNPDFHCWQTHTKAFEDLHEKYPGEYQGIFNTFSDGSDPGKPNCFAFPLSNGGFRITRFGRGAREHESWVQDGRDWTWVYFNRPPNMQQAAVAYGGAARKDGKSWSFTNLDDVQKVIEALGDRLDLDPHWAEMFGTDRKFILSANKANQLVVQMEKKKEDRTPRGWSEEGTKYEKLLRSVVNETVADEDKILLDHRVRALVDSNDQFSEWMLRNDDGVWVAHSKDNIRSALKGMNIPEAEEALGRLVLKNWKRVQVPFQPEYLGNRQWNKHAPQFAVEPAPLTDDNPDPHPHWDLIMSHCGQDLDAELKENKWCRDNGIVFGSDYLKLWIAFMFREPYYKLPYLFFYGPQNSGKSIFHEAISLLMTRGVVLADEALKNTGNFNGELAGAVLCVVEETNLSGERSPAYNRMKAWVTGEDILIHAKREQPYLLRNTTHWCQMANEQSFCPIFPGDTRITMMHVPMVENEIPKDLLMIRLREEAPAFLRTILDLKLPPPPGRLRLPIIATESKRDAEQAAQTLVDEFIATKCHRIPGALLKLQEFYDAMKEWMSEDQRYIWTYQKVVNEFRNRELLPMGKALNSVLCLGNISLQPLQEGEDYGKPYVRFQQKLVRSEG